MADSDSVWRTKMFEVRSRDNRRRRHRRRRRRQCRLATGATAPCLVPMCVAAAAAMRDDTDVQWLEPMDNRVL